MESTYSENYLWNQPKPNKIHSEKAIPEKPTHRKHIPALDGLRGIAILLVVFYHNFGFTNYFFFGWLGVDLFFVLSGFLITDILLRTVNTEGYLRNFYMKRVLRIFPLYYLSLLLFLVILPKIRNYPLDMSYYIEHQEWFWTYMQNWFLIFYNPGYTTTVIQHFWSLAVEEQFYIIWPWVILFIRKPKVILWIAGLLLLLVIAVRITIWTMNFKDLNYFGLYTFSRIDGICIGSMLAILQHMRSRFLDRHFTWVVLGLAALNFIFYFFNRVNEFTFPYLAIVGYTTFAVMFALLVHEAVKGQNKIINTLLSFSWLRFFGKISYGFYIFHWPVYLIFHKAMYTALMNDWHLADRMAQVLTSTILTLAGLLVSVISFYGFEIHFLKMKKSFEK